MSTIRLIGGLQLIVDAMQADIDAENAMWQALYEEEKRAIDDELDWLGDYQGRDAR